MEADGNCGFRVVSDYIFGSEQYWRWARVNIANELAANRSLYEPMCVDGVDAAIARIRWDGGSCGPDHWMTVAEDLFPIATLYNAAVFLFGYGSGHSSLSYCMTVLPLHAPSTATRPEREIVIAHLGDRFKHFIRLDLVPNFPVPPIANFWHRHRARSVFGWDLLYAARRAQWDRLHNAMM